MIYNNERDPNVVDWEQQNNQEINNMINTISIERLDQIENERAKTFNDPAFIKWMKKFKVSRLVSNPNAMEQTRRAMEDYNYSNYKFPGVR